MHRFLPGTWHIEPCLRRDTEVVICGDPCLCSQRTVLSRRAPRKACRAPGCALSSVVQLHFCFFPNYHNRWETQPRKTSFCKKGKRSCFALAPGLADGKSFLKLLPKGCCSGMAFPLSDQLTGSRASSPSWMYQSTLCTSRGRYLHAAFLCRL